MDGIKAISEDELRDIASKMPYSWLVLVKDYYITIMLCLLKEIDGIYFKGGTALQKVFLRHTRLSEDIDYTVKGNLKEIIEKITGILEKSGLFTGMAVEKEREGFARITAKYRAFGKYEGSVFIDLNSRGTILRNPEMHSVNHFYAGFIPEFEIRTLAKAEAAAEKVRAAIQRNKPRDHYDIYMILKAGIPIDNEIVRMKCADSGIEFDITKMFNKASRLKHRWDDDLMPLMAEKVSFDEVMKTLAGHFKLKEEKKAKKEFNAKKQKTG
ncbi:MAG: nucleotidyl transferase AbiEii/AbiGii toxin family protein [Candidatus Nanoarchaeia archaeon]|nr:nucleotidyl transferase AbiEii/AbiGii toxin family protein [Candidatus Nanoarchaeia archaeon]